MRSEQYFKFSNDTLEFNASNTENFSLETLFIEVGDNFNNLELKNFSLDSDWSFLKKFQSIKSLVIKDSYIDYQNFYNSILLLKNLEKLTYNHYCFFNKKKGDTIGAGLALPSIKIFKLEFPIIEEPNFEENNWRFKSHEKKFNFIADLKNGHEIFPNLEEIQFVNYKIYLNRLKENCNDKRKIKSLIYWNTEFKKLTNFKTLKNIRIDKGDISSLFLCGFYENVENILGKIPYSINGIKEEIKSYPPEFSVLNFLRCSLDEFNIFSRINSNLNKSCVSILKDSKNLNINLSNFYNSSNSNKYKLRKNKTYEKILRNNFHTIIFSPTYDFCDSDAENSKINLFIDLFKNQKSLNNIVFDLTYNEKDYNGDLKEYTSDQIIYLLKFISTIIEKAPNIKIFLYLEKIKELITNKKSKNRFTKHLIIILNYLIRNKANLNNRVEFLNVRYEELKSFYESYKLDNIKNVIEVDDVIFKHSKRFNDYEIVYGDQTWDMHKNFVYFNEDFYNKKFNIPFKKTYQDFLRISSFRFDDNLKKELFILTRKGKINSSSIKQIDKYCIFLGSPSSYIGNMIDSKPKIFHANKTFNDDDLVPNKKTIEIKNKVIDLFTQSEEFFDHSNLKKQFLNSLDEINYMPEDHVIKEMGKNLSYLWIEGVKPNLEKYIILKDLPKYFYLDNLEELRVSDCIALNDKTLPHLPKLKRMRLDFSANHHNDLFFPDKNDFDNKLFKLNGFKDLPNLEKLEIWSLYNNYNKDFTKQLTMYSKPTSRWSITDINFEGIENTKLKDLIIYGIKSSCLKSIKSLPSVEKIKIEMFNISEDMFPDHKKTIKKSIEDEDLKFLKGSKNIKNLELDFGHIWNNEDNYGDFFSSNYDGTGEFLNNISHNIETLILNINLDINKQEQIQDIINKISNRFFKLVELKINFGFSLKEDAFDYGKNKYYKKINTQIIDFKKFAKLRNLEALSLYGWSSFLKFKTINFDQLVNLKKIKKLSWFYETIPFNDFRKTREAFKNEKYHHPANYDSEYEYYEEDSEYRKNWTRFNHINTDVDDWDWIPLEDKYLNKEREENKKNFKKPKLIINNK